MAVPHDPAHHARLSYSWRDENWHLLDQPATTVVLLNDSVSKGESYATPALAEQAFWRAVTDSLLSHQERVLTTAWDGTEVGLLVDYSTGLFHLAYRTPNSTAAVSHTDEAKAREDWEETVRTLLAERFRGWSIWRSNTGGWWATRHAAPNKAEAMSGCARTVDADTPARLAECLAEQERRTRTAAAS
ncbi:hypothetical protein [Streptosporangium roseum]|uniref:hypothetical protein n=1 Tax=Streptosporangium roseum TaxID=2001 RepID=UPI001E4D92EF|nr:hypothetical protein [Streptosporangium roseum]